MKIIDKAKLIEKIKIQLEQDFEKLKSAALATYEDATHEESKPENEYDTRGLEASYLAGAQGKRLAELEEVYAAIKFLKVKNFSDQDVIELSALVEVDLKGKKQFLLIAPKGGGIIIEYDGLSIQVIASYSPLGEALLGLKKGDVAIIDSGHREIEYDIINVW
ncbi:MAG: hypothetical protein ACK4VO_10795 [Pseudobdellovibrio sp.]